MDLEQAKEVVKDPDHPDFHSAAKSVASHILQQLLSPEVLTALSTVLLGWLTRPRR